jgi:hypothetical protein
MLSQCATRDRWAQSGSAGAGSRSAPGGRTGLEDPLAYLGTRQNDGAPGGTLVVCQGGCPVGPMQAE